MSEQIDRAIALLRGLADEAEPHTEGAPSLHPLEITGLRAAADELSTLSSKLSTCSKANEDLAEQIRLRDAEIDQWRAHAAERVDTFERERSSLASRLDALQLDYNHHAERATIRIDQLEQLLATAYQLAGLVGAPLRFLDAYSRHEGDIDSLLPVDLSELDEFKALQGRLDKIAAVLRGPYPIPKNDQDLATAMTTLMSIVEQVQALACREPFPVVCDGYVIDSYEGTHCGKCGREQEEH